MAVNSLFQTYKKHEIFNTKTVHNRNKYQYLAMSQTPGRPNKPGPGKKGTQHQECLEEEPQSKRRRVEEPQPDEAGDWDDFEMTQHDLETIDIMASQAIGEPSTSRQGAEPEHRESEQTLELGATSFSVTGQGQPGLFQAPAPGATVRHKNRSSTSSSSESSAYPQSSSSLRKTSSSDISSAAGSLTSSKSSGHRSSDEHSLGDVTVITPGLSTQGASTSNVTTVANLREDLRKKTGEVQKARTELYAKDGEVKFLKESLHKQERELEKLRAEKAERKEEEERRQKEREKELKQEVERLETQVQFKAQDCVQLQQRCRTLENKLTQQQTASPLAAQPSTSTGGVTTSQPQGSPDKSPKVRKVVTRGNKTPEKGVFPCQHSFMSAVDVSASPPRMAAVSSHSRESVMTRELHMPSTSQPDGSERQKQQQRLKLSVPCPGGKTPGSQLVSQLLQCSCINSGEIEDSGILGLLQMLPSRLDLAELQYERDGTTARLSPIKKSRRQSSSGVLVQQPPQTQAQRPIVEREHFLLAAQGLRQLIDSSPSCEPSVSERTAPAQPRGAVLLLPMVNDYLSHYVDILSCSGGLPGPTSPNLSSSSNRSSSCEMGSSLESMTSSLNLLLQQGAEYANSMETLTQCALRVLRTLVCVCGDVRSVCVSSRVGPSLIQPATDTSSSTIETDAEKEKTTESGIEGDDEQSTTSSSIIASPEESLGSPAHRLQGLNLLDKLIRLASPGQESSGFNSLIVEAALDVLTALAVNLPHTDMHRLHGIIVRGVITKCVQLERQPCITTRALDLFSCLMRSRSILPFLCTTDDTCTLLNIHLVLTHLLATCRGKHQFQPLLLHSISKVMDSISSVASFHRNGVQFLTDNNCRCSAQIIPSLVHSMFYLLRDYQVSQCDYVFRVLRKGVLLLHEISLRDHNYIQRHAPVHLHYSLLMSGLTRVYKGKEDLPHVEASALDDLWEELDESEDSGSQDSDREEPMQVG